MLHRNFNKCIPEFKDEDYVKISLEKYESLKSFEKAFEAEYVNLGWEDRYTKFFYKKNDEDFIELIKNDLGDFQEVERLRGLNSDLEDYTWKLKRKSLIGIIKWWFKNK